MDALPPLAAVRVFESAARHLSFTAAAAELGMTQAGVSYQIRLLEERLGGALFLRRPRLALTDQGARLAAPTQAAFAQLRDAWHQTPAQETLSITTLPTFATNWLSQRLGLFQLHNPGLAVRLDSSERIVDFAREDFDVAIRYGGGDWPGLESHHLFDITLTPMLSPALLAQHGPLARPADIVPLPWLDPTDPCWAQWLAAAGVAHAPCPPRPGLTLGTQIHEARAAMAGTGVAMLTPRFFRTELATGALVQPFDIVARNGKAYWLAYPPARRNRPVIRRLRRFLAEQVAADRDD
ncbi:LysR substrate-binding domain-containing protein [Paracoccus luteus]|uniref:LysR substrate-binding domain-containing protein n=1 Tax=Paracoccus luteus TaxID=2508543 RepID=UPI00106F4689|nr:LysR substrate-binding domain-containing protein [Paracoccus luteus]